MITVRLSGGMGNQMFQYATGRTLALKYNVPLQLDTTYLLDRTPRKHFTFREYDLDVFAIAVQVVSHKTSFWQLKLEKIKNKLLRPRGVEKHFSFDPAVLSWGPEMTLQGYWQSPKYFSEIQDVIRADFALKNPLSENTKTVLAEIKNTASVAIHVRRGDYVSNTFHDVGLDQEYYNEGLRRITDQYTVEKIYVFSDDIEWCKHNLHFDIATVFVGPEYAGIKGEEHLMLMSACQHFIIPNSTFSWWAAWLCTNPQKIVVAPKQWFKDDIIDGNDLIPQEWVRL
jgi:hypothetical protein